MVVGWLLLVCVLLGFDALGLWFVVLWVWCVGGFWSLIVVLVDLGWCFGWVVYLICLVWFCV